MSALSRKRQALPSPERSNSVALPFYSEIRLVYIARHNILENAPKSAHNVAILHYNYLNYRIALRYYIEMSIVRRLRSPQEPEADWDRI